MHKGRNYPYAWRRWGTNFLFWPDLPPNRFVFGRTAVGDDTWDILPDFSTPMRTGRGVYLFGGTWMEYRFHSPDNTFFGRIILRNTGVSPGADGQMRFILSIAGGGRAKAETVVPFADNTDKAGDFAVTILNPPFDCPSGFVSLHVRPATWLEDPRGGDRPVFLP